MRVLPTTLKFVLTLNLTLAADRNAAACLPERIVETERHCP